MNSLYIINNGQNYGKESIGYLLSANRMIASNTMKDILCMSEGKINPLMT